MSFITAHSVQAIAELHEEEKDEKNIQSLFTEDDNLPHHFITNMINLP